MCAAQRPEAPIVIPEVYPQENRGVLNLVIFLLHSKSARFFREQEIFKEECREIISARQTCLLVDGAALLSRGGFCDRSNLSDFFVTQTLQEQQGDFFFSR